MSFRAEPSTSERVWAAGEEHPHCADWGWKNTSTEMSQKSSKCVVSQNKCPHPHRSSRGELQRKGKRGGVLKGKVSKNLPQNPSLGPLAPWALWSKSKETQSKWGPEENPEKSQPNSNLNMLKIKKTKSTPWPHGAQAPKMHFGMSSDSLDSSGMRLWKEYGV